MMSPSSFNHVQATNYYAESINSDTGFWGFECNEWKDWAFGSCRESNSTVFAKMGWQATNE